jgi:hypothetical protein
VAATPSHAPWGWTWPPGSVPSTCFQQVKPPIFSVQGPCPWGARFGGRWPRPAPGLGPLPPPPVLAAAGRGLRPRVFPAHGPPPQLQVQDAVMGQRPVVGIAYIQTGGDLLLQAVFTTWPDLVPIYTGAPAQIRAADRPSGTPAVLPSIYMASVDSRPHGVFAAICEVLRDHTARACSNGRLSDRLRFFMCRLVLCGSSAGQSRRRKRPLPSRQGVTWLSACRRREKRPSSSTRQANKVGRMSRRASRI